MYYNYINDWHNPIFEICDSNSNLIDKIELEMPNMGGYSERYEEVDLNFDLIDYSILPFTVGFYIHFYIGYSNQSTNTNMLLFEKLRNYKQQNRIIKLIPNKNIGWRKYKVFFEKLDYTLSHSLGGYYSTGMKGLEMTLRTTDLQTSTDWIDPNSIQYYGSALLLPEGNLQEA